MTTTLQTQDSGVNQKHAQQARAALFNLVAYAPSSNSLINIRELVQTVGFRFPCRIILIEVNDSNKGLEVEKVPCPSEERQRTYDQLIIHVSRKELDKVPFVVMPYLIPDVPIYLLWGQDPTLDDKVLPFFKNFASRVIFDASSTDDLSAFAERALKRGSPTGDNFMDISWAVIGGWRDVLARLFNEPEALEELRCCKKIRVVCRRRVDFSAGVYLLNWLAARLGWNFSRSRLEDNLLEVAYSNPKGETLAYVSESEDGLETGIASVEIVTYSDVVYQMTHRSPSRTVVSHVIRTDCCELPITLPFSCLNRSQALMKELLHQRSGEHYRMMLNKLAQFSNKS